MPANPALVKTQMCNRGDQCTRGRYCTFAHNRDELRCVAYALNNYCARHREGRCALQHTASPGVAAPGANRRAAVDPAAAEDIPETSLDPRQYYGHATRWKSAGHKPRDSLPRYVRRLVKMKMPAALKRNIAKCKEDARRRLVIPRSILAQLDSTNFEERLSAQLIVERAQCEHDIRIFDLEPGEMTPVTHPNAVPPRGYSFYKVVCPGLAEKRPSVLRGDAIHVFDRTFEEWHVGFVFWVNVDNLTVCMSETLALYVYPKIVFSLPESVFDKLHTAIKTAVDYRPRLEWASTPIDGLGMAMVPALTSYLNALQRTFVMDVCHHAKLLHLLHGPPGTGKTTTLVYLMSALLMNHDVRILVMTPSNQSADLIVQRLNRTCPALQGGDVLRVTALSRDPKSVPADVRPFLPPGGTVRVEDVARARVVVTTLMTASTIFGVIPHGHDAADFTHYVVDEAAQATEQELLVGLQFMAETQASSLVLAGDHKQLGPIIRNAACKRSGMSCSALERLVVAEEAPHTMLTNNYRAHPMLVELINPTYRGELVAVQRDLSLVYDQPLLFVHVDGKETQEPDSPSWLNTAEKDEVLLQINQVMRRGVRPSDIVVLAPYQKQVQKIRGSLHFRSVSDANERDLKDVEVCSVEMFQGREARVVILSCVRSRRSDVVEQDVVYSIGFLKNAKRLNVALSRARDLLVIVGNSSLLASCDAEWKRIVDFCAARGLLLGAPPPSTMPPPTAPASVAPVPRRAARAAAVDTDSDGDVMTQAASTTLAMEWGRPQ